MGYPFQTQYTKYSAKHIHLQNCALTVSIVEGYLSLIIRISYYMGLHVILGISQNSYDSAKGA